MELALVSSHLAANTGSRLRFHLVPIQVTVCCEFFGPLWMCLFTPTSKALIRKLGQWGEMLRWICIRPALCGGWGVLGFAVLPSYHSSCSLLSRHTHASVHFLSAGPDSPPLFSLAYSLPGWKASASFSFIASVWFGEGQECSNLIVQWLSASLDTLCCFCPSVFFALWSTKKPQCRFY